MGYLWLDENNRSQADPGEGICLKQVYPNASANASTIADADAKINTSVNAMTTTNTSCNANSKATIRMLLIYC